MKYLLISMLALTACATTQPVTQDSKPRELNLAAVPKEEIKKFNDPIRSIAESQIKNPNCSKLFTKVKGKWNWRDAVEASTACLKTRETLRVEDLAQDLAQKEPLSPWGPYFLAVTSKDRGELDRAMWFVELALHRAPESGVVHYLRGQILWNKKDFGPAVSAFEKASQFDDSILPAHLLLGQIFFRDQDFTKASLHFYSVLKVEPRNKTALYGYAESQIEEKNPQAAVDAYARLNDTDPTDGQYLARLAEIQESILHNNAEALGLYKQLKQNIKSGRVVKNIDADVDSKIKQLEGAVQRAVANSKEK